MYTKFISDKKIMAINPFEDVEKDLEFLLNGYSFLDFLKLQHTKPQVVSQAIERDIQRYYISSSREPICAQHGPTHAKINIEFYFVT